MSSDSTRRPTVLLIGLGSTTSSALDVLAERFVVVGLVRAGEPGDPVVARAEGLGVPVYGETTLKDVRRIVEQLDPDCVVVSSYNRVLPADLLATRRFVNVHYAPLPRYRGRANVNWAIINGEESTGITIHTIAPGLDAGNVLFQQLIPIGERDTVADLYERLNRTQREALGDAVQRLLDGDAGMPQDDASSTYGCTRLPEDGAIDWSDSTVEIDRLVRALVAPFPGAFTYFDGSRLFVRRAEPVREPPRYVGRIPGRVVAVGNEGHVDVLTGDGIFRLIEVQREGEAPVPAARVIGSVKSTLGLSTRDLLRRIEELERDLASLRWAAQDAKDGAIA